MKKIILPYGFKAYSGISYAYLDKALANGEIYLNGITPDSEKLQYVVEVSICGNVSPICTLENLENLNSVAIANSIQDAFDLFTKIRAVKILRHAEIFVHMYESTGEYEVIASLIPYTSVDNIDIVLNALASVADSYGEAIAIGLHRKEELGLYANDTQNSLLL